jgi:undecaprenyl diphosphate synthase
VARAAFDAGVEVFSFWWGSPANLEKRPASEEIVPALQDWLDQSLPGLCAETGARFDAFGRWPELCPGLRAPSIPGGPRHVVLLMAYDGREELQAAQGRLPDGLWTAGLPPVDLVVRTGGETHLSAGFMLWHIAEAQLAFLPEFWPELEPERFRRLLLERGRVRRRYGA